MDRLLLAQRLQCYLAFELCGEFTSFFHGCYTLVGDSNLSNFTGPAQFLKGRFLLTVKMQILKKTLL